MDTRYEIKKLARIEEGPYPFCSLYLDTKWDDEQQRERIRLFTKNQLKKASDRLKDRPDWRKPFAEDQERIERYVEGVVRQVGEGANGIAVFSCSGRGTFIVYPSFIPFENQFVLSDLPTLQPLVRLSSQYQNTLAVMVETDSARLYELSLEGMVAESSIENYVPGRHDQGGWAQMRYQRHIKDHMNRHHKEVAEQLTELFDSNQWKRIVLIGQDRIITNFRSFLPDRVKQQITDAFSVDFSQERSKVLRRVFERLLQKEREAVQLQVQNILERPPQGGLATLGLNGTLESLNRGQIQTLFLLSAFSLRGGKCRRCGNLSMVQPPEHSAPPCPLCKGEVRIVDLGEEMVRTVLRHDGEVKWLEESGILKEQDGVGASLRFR